MKKIPKILPTYYKSIGTPIFRDTTALPFTDGGPVKKEPIKPWNKAQLSPERIAALKKLHGDSIFSSANINDLLFYDLNKEEIDNALNFTQFLNPSLEEKTRTMFKDQQLTEDLKARLSKGWALDTKTGTYFKVPDEIYKEIVEPIDFIPILPPEKLNKKYQNIIDTFIPGPEKPTYLPPSYKVNRPEFYLAHHTSNQLIPHARLTKSETDKLVPTIMSKIVQKTTNYDPNFIEGYEDEDGNWVPGELEKAEQEGRKINFQGFNSIQDKKAQKEYNAAYDAYEKYEKAKEFYGQMFIPTAQHADGGPLNDRNIKGDLLPSVYASALGRYYSNGGKFITAGGEYHKIYKNAEGDIMVNHPKEDKGKWDTINLTEKSGANTISEGVDATKQWHADNPNVYANGGMIKRADGSYSKRGLWDNIRANAGSGKEPTKEMLAQEKQINNEYSEGGQLKPDYSLPEDSFQQGGRGLKNSVYASSMGQYPANYAKGGYIIEDISLPSLNRMDNGGTLYTYAGNPNASYKKIGDQWYISNKNTRYNYVPINDPEGKRAVELNKNAVLLPGQPAPTEATYFDRPIQGAPKPVSLPLITKEQQYNNIKNSPLITDQKKAKQLQDELITKDIYFPQVPIEGEPGSYPENLEGYVDKVLGYPEAKAEIAAYAAAPSGEDALDNFRHSNAGRYTTEGIADLTGNIPYISPLMGMIGANVLGIGHEASGFMDDSRPFLVKLRESGEDAYNNFIGSIVGSSDMSDVDKTNYLRWLSDNNKLPDGINNPNKKPGMSNNLYLKNGPNDKGSYNNKYPDGGQIYTYPKRPGSYYKKDKNGQWYISNKGTGGQYVLVNDPSGQRTAALNKGAVVIMSNPTAPTKDYSKVTPSYNKSGMVQSVAGRTEAERQPVQNDIDTQKVLNYMDKTYAEHTKNQLPQHEQPLDMMDYAWQTAAGLPTGLKAVGQLAAVQIPYAGISLGTAAQTAGVIHGTTQVPNRIQDWKDVYAGKMDYRDALLNSALTAGEFIGTKSAYNDIANATKKLITPLKTAGTGKTLITADAPKKVVGILDDFDEPIGASVPIGANKNTVVDISGKPHAIDLAAWQKAKGNAEANDWRFIISEQEEQFLASKYAQEFADKYNVPIENLDSYDVALYGKLRESENLPIRQVNPVSKQLSKNEEELHNTFMKQQQPKLDLNTNEELVVDAYTRGYDSKINSRGNIQGADFYKDELATPLEEIILKNKLKQPTTLVRGSKDFNIADTSSVIRNGEPISNLKFSQLQEGDVFVPNTFTSTRISNVDPNAPQIPSSNFTLQPGSLDYIINAPAGQSYLYPNASNIHNYVGELEAVLPKNLQFKLDKVVSDVDRGYISTAADVKPGIQYGVGSNAFIRVPNKYLPFLKSLDKIKQAKWDPKIYDYTTTLKRISKNDYQKLIDLHNQTHQPTIPKYHFSILNPYKLGGILNKNYYF